MSRSWKLRFEYSRAACRALTCLAILAATSGVAMAQLPVARLSYVFPPGGKVGSSFDATIAGTDLDQASKLVFTHPGITGVPKTRDPNPFENGPQPIDNTFVIKIDASVPTGWHEVRVVSKFGISNPRAFLVDDLTEAAEKEPNNTRETASPLEIGSVVNAQISGATDMDYYKFTAKKGQRLIFDCWASRIDSRLDPALAVFDVNGRELESSQNSSYRDAVIDFTVPADGDYLIRVRDVIYGGSPEYFYRLSVSAKPFVDYVLPIAGQPGTKGAFTLFGRNLPGGADAGVYVDGKPLQKLAVTIDIPTGPEALRLSGGTLLEPAAASIDGFEYRFKGPTGTANAVMIGFASSPVILEQEPNGPEQPQKVAVPCEFVGQSQASRDKDCLQFDAKANDVLWLEMISQRHGVSLDPYFVVQRVIVDKDGKQTIQDMTAVDDSIPNIGGTSFNTQCDDGSFRFVAPADGTYRVLIRDLYNRGNPKFVYRLAIRPEQPDFRLAALAAFPSNPQQPMANPWSALLRRGGVESLQVMAFRRDGFNENIEVSVEGLPPGVTCPPITLGPNQNLAKLALTAADNAADWVGTIKVVGKATIKGQAVTREARGGEVIWPGVQNQAPPSRLSRDIALAVISADTAPFQVNVGDGKVQETYRGGKLEIPVKAIRRNNFAGNLQLTPVGLLPNVQIPALALNGTAVDGKLAVTIPVGMAAGTYTFSLQAITQVPYAKNADLAKAAEAEKARVDKIVNDLTAEAKRLTDELAKVNASKSTNEAKAAAKKAADDAAAKLAAAKAFQQTVVQRATALANSSKPQNINVALPTSSFTITVAEAPIAFAAAPPATKIKQGAKAEITVNVNRLFGYAEPITVELVPPGGASGVTAAAVTVPAGQTQAKLMVQAAANATAGAHTFVVRATARPGGQAMPINQNLALTVEADQPAKK